MAAIPATRAVRSAKILAKAVLSSRLSIIPIKPLCAPFGPDPSSPLSLGKMIKVCRWAFGKILFSGRF